MLESEKRFQIKELKVFLQGEWRLERRIDDRRAGERGCFDGGAVFVTDADGLLYREDGRLVLGSHDGPALQHYRYDFLDRHHAAVSFRDGRFFHELDLSAGAWRCRHLCGEDRYDGEFAALGADAWRVVWHVSGPRKDLILDSTYRRAL